MSVRLSSWLLLFLLLFFRADSARSAELRVAAASDLSAIGSELQRGYTVDHLTFVFGSSAMLAQQIGNGAPFDAFLSANAQFVDELAHSGTIDPVTVRAYALGRLGLLWRDGQQHPIRELATSRTKILALPNPKLAPYGVAAQQALEYGGLWSMVQPKVVYGENVRQTLQYLDSGNADAVITSDSLLQGRKAEVLPAEWHAQIVQKAGVVADTKHRSEARKFLDYLGSPEARAIFARYGFSAP